MDAAASLRLSMDFASSLSSEREEVGEASRFRLFRTGREENWARDCGAEEFVDMGSVNSGIVERRWDVGCEGD